MNPRASFDPIDRTLSKLTDRKHCSCEPVSITMGVMAVAGAATQIAGQNTQRQMAKGAENAKKNAQDDLIIENRKRATHDYLREVRLEQLAQAQEEKSLAEKSNDVAKSADAAKGTAQASAAERGVSGNSLDTLISDYEFQQNQEVGRLRINQNMKNNQHTENIAASKDQFNYSVSAVRPYVPRVQPPVDYFGPIFGAIGGIAGGMKTPTAETSTGPRSVIKKDTYGEEFLKGTGSNINR